MRKHALAFAAAAALGLGTICSVNADDNARTGSAGASAGAMATASGGDQDIQQALSQANDPDRFFALCASIDNEFESQLGQIAQQKAQDDHVKQIAQRMVQDHQQANQQLQQAVQGSGWQLAKGLPAIKQQELRVFQSLSGKEFDQQYISHMKAGHAKAVNEYTDVAQLAKNQQIKDYAQKTLPKLQEHYQHVQQAATALGMQSGAEAQPAGARMRGSNDMNTGTEIRSGTDMRSGTSSGAGATGTGATGSGATGTNEAGKAPERNTGTDVPRAGSPTDQGATK